MAKGGIPQNKWHWSVEYKESNLLWGCLIEEIKVTLFNMKVLKPQQLYLIQIE